jgi:hypothetical protein
MNAGNYVNIERLKDIIIDSKGVLRGGETEKERVKEKRLEMNLLNYLEMFRKRELEYICVPFTTKVAGFKGLSILFGNKSELNNVCEKIHELVNEVVSLAKSIEVHGESVKSCIELASALNLPIGVTFALKYMTINRDLIYELVVKLIQRHSIRGCLLEIEDLIASGGDDYVELYSRCRSIKVGGNLVRRRFYALSRYLENLFVILGIGVHDERPRLYRVGKGRRESYSLAESPLTKSMKFLLESRIKSAIKLYIDAYKELSTYIIRGLMEGYSPHEVVARCSSTLEYYKKINVDNSLHLVENVTVAYLYLLKGLRILGP